MLIAYADPHLQIQMKIIHHYEIIQLHIKFKNCTNVNHRLAISNTQQDQHNDLLWFTHCGLI